eukprot:1157304_1
MDRHQTENVFGGKPNETRDQNAVLKASLKVRLRERLFSAKFNGPGGSGVYELKDARNTIHEVVLNNIKCGIPDIKRIEICPGQHLKFRLTGGFFESDPF